MKIKIPLQLISGNDLNTLADALGREFFSASSTPFERRLVVAPHPSIKEFLFKRFAKAPQLQIAAGVQVLPLHQAVMEILGSAAPLASRKRLPSLLELTLAIEEKLHVTSEEFSNLQIYLNAGDLGKRDRRIAALSDELAHLFVRYGLFGKHFLPQWLKCKGWQQTLWKSVFSEDSAWTYPLQLLQSEWVGQFQGKIALFGFSYLSAAHLSFFAHLSASVYRLSACALFWEDLVSDKQRLLTNRFLQRQGADIEVREQIDGYMQESHCLLGNFGKLGREMLKALDAFPVSETEIYNSSNKESLLGQLKDSMLYLDEENALPGDDSIQLHSATSLLREVEICRDVLQTLLHQSSQGDSPMQLRDIVVCSPDIASYAPYIHMLFSQSGFAYSLEAEPLRNLSGVRGFLQLLELPVERYCLESVLQLLRCPQLLEKWLFSSDEIQRLREWFKEAKVLQDLQGHPNSWEEGIDRLIFGLAMSSGVASIAQSEIDLFNRFLFFFSTLKNDLAALVGKRSAPEWLGLFVRIASKYFAIEWEREPFFGEMKGLALSCSTLKEKVWDFPSIARALHHLAGKTTGTTHSSQIDRITFTSLAEGSVQAARIVWCLGMDETLYPGADSKSSLCEMSRLKAVDYFPSKRDEERLFFLEMLLKAQDYLLFSYQRIHREDGKEQGPSPFIEELDQYLQKRGVVGGMKKVDHPGLSLVPSECAQEAAHISPFFQPITIPQERHTITIRQLKKLARNPLQFYFNQALKIYLQEPQDEEEEQFWISSLRRATLRKKTLQHSLPQVVRQLEGRGEMPRGLFSQVAQAEMQEEMECFLNALDRFFLSPEEICSVNLSQVCREEEEKKGARELCIQLSNSKSVHIIGKLEDFTSKGLLVHGDKDLNTLVKAWPLYLIYCSLYPENQKTLILTKKGVKLDLPLEDPRACLASYLEYYFLAECSPSPLMPDWAKAVLLEQEEQLQKLLAKPPLYEDSYVSYLHRRKAPFDAKELLLQWSDVVKKTFGPLLHAL